MSGNQQLINQLLHQRKQMRLTQAIFHSLAVTRTRKLVSELEPLGGTWGCALRASQLSSFCFSFKAARSSL